MSKLDSYTYPNGSKIRIRVKLNSNQTGVFGYSYQVDIPEGVTSGKRIRKQFTSKKEAESFAKEQYDGLKNQGVPYFDSTPQERNEFVEVLPQLRDAGLSLKQAVSFALERIRPKGGDKYIRHIISELLAHKEKLLTRKQLRPDTVKSFRSKSKFISEEFGGLLIKDLKIEEVILWINSMELRDRTKKNYLTCLNEILSYAKNKQYIFDNILDSLTTYERKELFSEQEDSEPGILTIEESRRLIHAAYDNPGLGLLPVVTLALFCGIRTEELQRLKWEDVRLKEKFVLISASIAKKRKIRSVSLSSNAIAWLSSCAKKEGLIYDSREKLSYNSQFSLLLRKAEFLDPGGRKNSNGQVAICWKKNAMRHSFGSYHYALHDDAKKTAKELGHGDSTDMLFTHYRALTTKQLAKQYFSIYPNSADQVVVSFI